MTNSRTESNLAKIAESRALLRRLKEEAGGDTRPACRTADRIAKIHEDMASHLEERARARLRAAGAAELSGDPEAAERSRKQAGNDLTLAAAQLENAVWALIPPAVAGASVRQQALRLSRQANGDAATPHPLVASSD